MTELNVAMRFLCLGFCFITSPSNANAIKPVGTAVGFVQFDATIELGAKRGHDYELLFVRYWVGPDGYRFAVLWSEPQGSRLKFPIYPPGLSGRSDPHSFGISHFLVPGSDNDSLRPFPPEAFFSYMYGDFPISNIRFADEEAFRDRIFSDMVVLTNFPEGTFALNFRGHRKPYANSVSGLKVDARGDGFIESLDLIDMRGRTRKKVDYEYGRERPFQLRRAVVHIPERPIMVGLRNDGATVSVNRDRFKIKEFPILTEKGGRNCVVDFRSVALGTNHANLPASIKIFGVNSTNSPLRAAQLMHFQPCDAGALREGGTGGFSARFGQAYMSYYDLVRKHRRHRLSDLPPSDVSAIEELRQYFKIVQPSEDRSVGEQLRRVNLQMELNELLEDDPAVEKDFERYLSLLAENNLCQMVLVGGTAFVERVALRGRYRQADALLDRLITVASSVTESDAVVRFAAAELGHGNLWVTARVLERFAETSDASPEVRFECAAIRTIALSKLRDYRDQHGLQRPQDIQAELSLLSERMNPADLESSLSKCILESLQMVSQINVLTPLQKELRSRIDKISNDTAPLTSEPR